MTPLRRKFMLNIVQDRSEIVPFMHYLDRFHRCDDMLEWLVKNNLTGLRFLDFTKDRCKGSMLEVARYLLQRCEKTKEARPVLIMRDFV